MGGPFFSVKSGRVPGFHRGSEYSVTPESITKLTLNELPINAITMGFICTLYGKCCLFHKPTVNSFQFLVYSGFIFTITTPIFLASEEKPQH